SLGLDPVVLSEIIHKSSGNSWVLEKYNPCPGVIHNSSATSGYISGFMSRLMVKDLHLAVDAASLSPLSQVQRLPMTRQALALFEDHQSCLKEDLDFSSLFQYYETKQE
uniref:NAD-binding protein n=1 Tax=Thaumasiovibrio occultus TaxID=1891184 RepID=UPI00131C7101